MDTRSILRLTGIAGFMISAVATYIYVTHILMPAITPILMQQIESQLSNEGVSINQGEVSGIVSFLTTVMPITTLVGMVIGWLIEAAVLMALLRAFGIKAGFTDTWLYSGNYFYVSVVQTAITATTPLFNYSINAVAMHRGVLGEPALLAVGFAFTVLGSLLLAYIFAKTHETSTTKTLIPTLIALIIFWAISTIT
ncbi:hypothetical protein [Vulcanisaeta souniana]|nr:hypothetical protein [Vulcanisaeta souniana]BDR92422.1 hypothetical protein Vsou_15150 [Vulcanisaeta souniana JCM 11219]